MKEMIAAVKEWADIPDSMNDMLNAVPTASSVARIHIARMRNRRNHSFDDWSYRLLNIRPIIVDFSS